MAFNHENSINEEQVASFINDALNRVNESSEEDVEIYDLIKKIYKKNIPWSRRNYVTAYLIKQALQSKGGRYSKSERQERFNNKERRNESRSERAEKTFKNENTRVEKKTEKVEKAERSAAQEKVEKTPRVSIDPAMSTTIFIGIGRNRRVYPRDLVGLLVSVAGLERDRIGDIRVLANYSFIQLFTEDCEKTISALNGYEYRGRKLSVSYSKQKDDEDVTESSVSAEKTENAPKSVESESKSFKNVEETVIPVEDEKIPENVTNDTYGVKTDSESDRIAKEQMAFAATQSSMADIKPYAETTDDGQVKSHFGDGAAY